ncbi:MULTISPECIES: glycoside hydrolase family 15 protein [Parachlamydia]|uniref:glycoside hydrolase family 15 protein n=1 Tax=Parachlamydia TaxID=83551 RepID=UPI0001C17530|nr:glycoside hydrolase family 15 protein [Parachlamydia acanthamoebae]EFB40915.1 hypothetical protein pah_c178o012 [Parachlamydia acanthamoebae str. Hall's coccus]
MMDAIAPGEPGILPRWTSSAKIGVGTAASGDSNVWFTISHGILNEVYFPRIDVANIRDFGFIVTDGATFFSEEKRHAVHEYQLLEDGIPAYLLTNTCYEGRYRIEKKIIADPHRNVLLQEVTFYPLIGTFADYHLYALIAPHIRNAGMGNYARTGHYKCTPSLFAERAGTVLACASSSPFIQMSCGFVGISDAWQDLSENKRLTQCYTTAQNGNISLVGEIDLQACQGKFVIALGFANQIEEAGLQIRASLFQDFNFPLKEYMNGWRQVQKCFIDLSTVDTEGGSLYRISTAVLKIHAGKHFSGSVIASLSIPWGVYRGDNDIGGYHLIWPRDQVQTALAFLSAGDLESAKQALLFLMCTQERDGHWLQCMWEDGTPYWKGFQLDETALPILLADQLKRADALIGIDPFEMVEVAAKFIVKNGPGTEQGRWEEDGGFSPYSIATAIAALLAAADFFEQKGRSEEADYLRKTADDWNDKIEDWLYAKNTSLAEALGIEGYYVHLAPISYYLQSLPENKQVVIRNRPVEESLANYDDIVGVDALALVRFGLRSANDPRILNTVKAIDALLRTETSKGPVWHRYNEDGYGEKEDGTPYDGTGIGRGWPLLVGERAHYELAKGDRDEAIRLLRVMRAFAGEGGMLPEQVWDVETIPEKFLFNGHSTGAAKPLVWAHGEYISLLRSIKENRIFTMPPQTFHRYIEQKQASTHTIWRFDFPVTAMQQEKTLRIQTDAPMIVRWTEDEWVSYQEQSSQMSNLGVSYVDIDFKNNIVFTFFWKDSNRWEGKNYEIVRI